MAFVPVPFIRAAMRNAAPLLVLLLSSLVPSAAPSQAAVFRTYCNPVDLDYKYNFEQLNEGISYRSGADPVILTHRGAYYLFETIGDGWWRSADLGHWEHVTPDRWPFEEIVAPAALAVRDTVYLFQSTFDQRPILSTTTPWNGHLEFYNRLMPPLPGSKASARPGEAGTGPWDPDIFHDDDTDRWFMYWGSSNLYPIYGIELDKSRRLAYLGTPKPLIALHPAQHGWERFGPDHRDTIAPYIEGAWMTKHRGVYYLQYAAPGTEYNVYANGTYTGASPLGPFTYAPYNPVSYKPGGFMAGAGHGNTFEDLYGNVWNTGTAWVAVNWNFERRIVMFPGGFDPGGQLYATTRFGDFPHWLPTAKWARADDSFTGWMLLSYRKPVTASSVQDTFPPSNTVDENVRTFWVAARNRPGEWLTIDLQREEDVKAIQVNYADYKANVFTDDSTVYTQFRLFASRDGTTWETVADLSRQRRDHPNAYVELSTPVHARFIKYEHVHSPGRHLAISDLRVFGSSAAGPPPAPARFTVRRDVDRRNAVAEWMPVKGATGYNVRWGITPTTLYETYQIWADQGTSLEVRALDVGQDYWFAIETFNEGGVSRLSAPMHVR
ncbi:MAG: family 43 glycosylhydrolase [Gemmatimonadaceae bacterium]